MQCLQLSSSSSSPKAKNVTWRSLFKCFFVRLLWGCFDNHLKTAQWHTNFHSTFFSYITTKISMRAICLFSADSLQLEVGMRYQWSPKHHRHSSPASRDVQKACQLPHASSSLLVSSEAPSLSGAQLEPHGHRSNFSRIGIFPVPLLLALVYCSANSGVPTLVTWKLTGSGFHTGYSSASQESRQVRESHIEFHLVTTGVEEACQLRMILAAFK